MKENKSQFSKDDLMKILTPLQYNVTQEKATEKPYTVQYDKFFETRKYNCIVCGTTVFRPVLFIILDLTRSLIHDVAGLLSQIITETVLSLLMIPQME